ncbi:MAG: U32 family peptidase [Coriobacteriia bacterium]|nr:U32 family peptidase [Coriobacteriia bacterium]
MELLAPAGGEEQLEYAMRFGADAVYLAAEKFGMRARATNFALDDLGRVVAKAHDGGVKVHLTCNVVMHPEDVRELPAFLEGAAAAKVDALIVGDLGAAAMARRYAPDVDLHVSTQASVCNAEAAKVWHDLGASRIVAAREMSLAELAELKQGMPAGMELEAFAHGAMCVAYSGRCLISDFMNGRSGIRGNCAQSCRWEYALMESWRPGEYYPVEEDGKSSYILNADDVCMLEHLDELAAAGVDSIKIEGRTKKAYYVACVVNAYRQVLDGAPASAFMRELECVSHRPYSTGFYFGPARQTPDNLVYVRKTRFAGQVLECQPAGDGQWRVKFKCRNNFSPDEPLEVLCPHEPVRPLRMTDLRHDPLSRTVVLTDGGVSGWKPRSEEPYPVEVADHPAEHYYALVDLPLQPGDIIRALDAQELQQG